MPPASATSLECLTKPSQEKLLLRLDQHSPLVKAGGHHPFDAILLPCQATSSSERLHLGELAARGFGAAGVGRPDDLPERHRWHGEQGRDQTLL
jgi:hypothetical protein